MAKVDDILGTVDERASATLNDNLNMELLRAETLSERFSKGGFYTKAIGSLDKSLVTRTEAIGKDAARVVNQISNLVAEVKKAQNKLDK